jgi:hypothetical protein
MNANERQALTQALEQIYEALCAIHRPSGLAIGSGQSLDHALHIHLGLLRQAIIQLDPHRLKDIKPICSACECPVDETGCGCNPPDA